MKAITLYEKRGNEIYEGIEYWVDYDFLPNGCPNRIRTFKNEEARAFAEEVEGRMIEVEKWRMPEA